MHIALDGLPLTAPKTGVGHYTFELARALADLVPGSSFVLPYPAIHPQIEVNGQLPQNLAFERVGVGPIARRWWAAGLPRHLRRSGIELFHGTNFEIPWWRPCATVLTIHDLSQFLYPEMHQRRSVRRAHRRLPRLAHAADAIITPSEGIRREVCEHFELAAEKVFAIPEAARACFRPLEFGATAKVRARLGVSEDFLLAVGTLEPRKNLAVLVSAFEEMVSVRPLSQTQLVIAGGRGWLTGPLFTAIEQSPVRDRIVLTDYLHDDDLQSLYSSCRAFVYPSVYEGFGLPPLEAMACGAPVIASRIPALVETTGDAALLFDPADVGELTEKILELLGENGEGVRRALTSAGKRRAAKFSWERTARETWQVYLAAQKRFVERRP
jgi:glycosyltransferase involved in cell wall biosynthesis